jgi:hypothetical protein
VQRTVIFKADAEYCGALHLKNPINLQNLQTFRGSAAFLIHLANFKTDGFGLPEEMPVAKARELIAFQLPRPPTGGRGN